MSFARSLATVASRLVVEHSPISNFTCAIFVALVKVAVFIVDANICRHMRVKARLSLAQHARALVVVGAA